MTDQIQDIQTLQQSCFRSTHISDLESSANSKSTKSSNDTTQNYFKLIRKHKLLKAQFQNIQNNFILIRSKLTPIGLMKNEFDDVCEKTLGSKLNLDDASTILRLDLKNKGCLEFIEAVCFKVLPNIKAIYIYNLKTEHTKLVNLLLENSLPKPLPVLRFNYSSCIPSMINLREHFAWLKGAARRVTGEFIICNCFVTAAEFSQLLAASAPRCRAFGFPDSYFDFENGLSLQNVKHSVLRMLDISGMQEAEDNYSNLSKFDTIITELNKCEEIKRTLKIISVRWCGISEADASKLINRTSWNDIKIVTI